MMNQRALLLLLLFSAHAFAQKGRKNGVTPAMTPIQVPMTPDAWTFKEGKAEFIEHRGVRAIKILPNSEPVVLNHATFTSGTVEFDVEPQDPRFVGLYFRRKNATESEYIYLRVGQATTNSLATDAIQYAPYIKGVLIWDLLPQFQGPATIKANAWNHVKLEVSGQQLRVYVNDMNRPVLHIPRLEADVSAGGFALDGASVVSGLVIRPGVETLVDGEGYDPTHNDPRYLRRWQVSAPAALPVGQDILATGPPKADVTWSPIEAERQGLVNLSRANGGANERRLVWLKTKLTAQMAQKALLRLGFSDEVWVYLNGQPVFTDKNLYLFPALRKVPDGRISIENTSLVLPLRMGDNELLIGVANHFYGWGLIARFDNLEGIQY